jgi:hypothetical protein
MCHLPRGFGGRLLGLPTLCAERRLTVEEIGRGVFTSRDTLRLGQPLCRRVMGRAGLPGAVFFHPPSEFCGTWLRGSAPDDGPSSQRLPSASCFMCTSNREARPREQSACGRGGAWWARAAWGAGEAVSRTPEEHRAQPVPRFGHLVGTVRRLFTLRCAPSILVQNVQNAVISRSLMVGATGIEPVTPTMSR